MPRRRSGRSPALPLKHRLPNPPSVFVGRREEAARLAELLSRGPVAVVVGPGGIGKTSLVLSTLHESFAKQVSRALYVGVRPDEPTDQVRQALVRLLAALQKSDVDLDALKGEPEAATAAAIDLAEAGEHWIVLDDVHHADADEMGELLVQLQSCARRSRWIATSRVRPQVPSIGAQILELGAMDEGALTELAQAIDPGRELPAIRRAVRASTGSPWFLQQYVSMGEAGLDVSREQLLGELPEAAGAFLEALGVLHAPMDPATVASFAPVPDPQTLALLERRGLVQQAEGGYRLHDVVRGLMFPAGGGGRQRDAQQRRAAEALSRDDDPESWLEAARLWAEVGEMAELRALLDAQGDELLSLGFAPRLWRIVSHLPDPGLLRFRLRCAAELGNATALSAVEQPNAPDPAERLAWARTLYAQGAIDRAAEEAERARSEKGDALEAALLLARCALHVGDVARAREALSSVRPASPEDALRRDALGALCAALEGDRTAVEDVRQRLHGAGELTAPLQEAARDVAAGLEVLARWDACDELLDLVLATPRGGRASILVARQALVLRARMRLEAGELVEVAELLDTVRPFARAPSILRPFVLELDAARALAAGELEGIEVRVETALRESATVDARCHERVRALAHRVALERGTEMFQKGQSLLKHGGMPERAEAVLVGGLAAARRGEQGLDGPLVSAETPRQRIVASLVHATEALVAGEAAAALEQASGAVRAAAVAEQRLLQAEALALTCDALVCADMTGELAERAQELAELAGWMGSERWRFVAELFLAPGDPATLERLAAAERIAPMAARRARALLGGQPWLDAVDAIVVEALRLASGDARMEVASGDVPADGWRPGWGLDDRRCAVWLPDGRTIDLSSRALLWRILSTMADRGRARVRLRGRSRVGVPGRAGVRVRVLIRAGGRARVRGRLGASAVGGGAGRGHRARGAGRGEQEQGDPGTSHGPSLGRGAPALDESVLTRAFASGPAAFGWTGRGWRTLQDSNL